MASLKSLRIGYRAFHDCSRIVFENLPQLQSITCGGGGLCFVEDASATLILRNLAKLTSLTTGGSYSDGTFTNPRHITLENMPSLTDVYLSSRYAFKYKNDVTIRGNIGALQRKFN